MAGSVRVSASSAITGHPMRAADSRASFLISLVVILFAALLIVTPPLAILTMQPDQPTPPMAPKGATSTISLLA